MHLLHPQVSNGWFEIEMTVIALKIMVNTRIADMCTVQRIRLG